MQRVQLDHKPVFVLLFFVEPITGQLSLSLLTLNQLQSCFFFQLMRSQSQSQFKYFILAYVKPIKTVIFSAEVEPIITLQVRAYDLGIPSLDAEVPVNIFTQVIIQ
jgi:hypothetical protein